jgi:hypothetical protein
VLGGDALVARHDELAVSADDVETRDLAAQAIGHQLELDRLAPGGRCRNHGTLEDLFGMFMPIAAAGSVTGILRRRSTRKNRQSFGSNSKSSQDPR